MIHGNLSKKDEEIILKKVIRCPVLIPDLTLYQFYNDQALTTQQMLHAEQDMLTLPEHLISLSVYMGLCWPSIIFHCCLLFICAHIHVFVISCIFFGLSGSCIVLKFSMLIPLLTQQLRYSCSLC
jgi:hypothetical protein